MNTFIVTITDCFDLEGNPYAAEFKADTRSKARYAAYRAWREISSQSFKWFMANTSVVRVAA